jgi:hypothetical protein
LSAVEATIRPRPDSGNTDGTSPSRVAEPGPAIEPPRDLPHGLTSDEADRRLKAIGPNATPDTASRPLRTTLGKLWAPVPWMLEAAIALQLVLGKFSEAASRSRAL